MLVLIGLADCSSNDNGSAEGVGPAGTLCTRRASNIIVRASVCDDGQ